MNHMTDLPTVPRTRKKKFHVFPLSIYQIIKKEFFLFKRRSVSFPKYNLHKDELISPALIVREFVGSGFQCRWDQYNFSISKEIFHLNGCFAGKLTGIELEVLKSETELMGKQIQIISFHMHKIRIRPFIGKLSKIIYVKRCSSLGKECYINQ